MRIIALFGPTGVGKTAVAIALARLLRARGEDPVAVSADALQVYAGLETLTGVGQPGRAGALEHRLLSFLPLDASFSVGEYAQLAHAQIDDAARAGQAPDRRRRHGPLPARGAHRARPAPGAARGRARALTAELERRRAAGAARAGSRSARPGRPRRSRRTTASASCARWSCWSWASSSRRRGRSQLWSEELRHPTLLAGLTMEREALYARDRRRVDAMVAAGAREEVRRARGRGRLGDRLARRSASTSCCAGDVEAMKRRTRNYARRQLTWMRKLAGVTRDRRDRPRPGGRGGRDPRLRRLDDDALREVAGPRQRLPDRRARRAAVRADARRACGGSASRTSASFADGVLLLSPPAEPRARRRPADLQPRRLGGRAVGQRRARGDPLPAPPRLDRPRRVLDPHRRRDDPPDDHRAGHLPRRHGPAPRSASEDFPGGPPDGRGDGASSAGRDAGRSGTSRSATRSARSRVADLRRAGGARPRRARPGDRSASELFPNRTNVSWYAELDPDRGAHPRAHLRARRGGDALLGHRRDRRRGRLLRRLRGGARPPA